MSNEIALYKVSDMQTMAEAVASSGLFGMKTPAQALALMLVAQAENQHPATITQDYDIIQGKACRKTHSVMARFQQMGGKVEWHELTESKADATFSHASGGSLRISWTIDQAKKANLTGKDNWKNYPRAMLRARLIAEGVRSVYPAAIGGMMVAEEAADSPIESDVVKLRSVDTSTGEVTPASKPELTECNDESFNAVRDKHKATIQAGTKSSADLIAWLSARTKLTDNQKNEIHSWKVEAAEFTEVNEPGSEG